MRTYQLQLSRFTPGLKWRRDIRDTGCGELWEISIHASSVCGGMPADYQRLSGTSVVLPNSPMSERAGESTSVAVLARHPDQMTTVLQLDIPREHMDTWDVHQQPLCSGENLDLGDRLYPT